MNSFTGGNINDIACVNTFEEVFNSSNINIFVTAITKKELHSMRMCFAVEGHWEVTHWGSSSPEKWKCRQLSKSRRKSSDVPVCVYLKRSAVQTLLKTSALKPSVTRQHCTLTVHHPSLLHRQLHNDDNSFFKIWAYHMCRWYSLIVIRVRNNRYNKTNEAN